MQILSKALLSLAAVAAAPLQAGEFRIVAISAAPEAVVLAAADGRLQRHAAGAALAAPGWRVLGVRNGRIVFEQTAATPLRVEAEVGDQLDFDALAARARPRSATTLRTIAKPAAGR